MKYVRRAVLVIALILIVLMVLFPPWHYVANGNEILSGYGWLFSTAVGKSTVLDKVDVLRLLTQLVVVVSIAGFAWLLLKDID